MADSGADDMADQSVTWAIVAMVDEPPALIQAFIAWHLRLGASEIFLYFDQPDDPAATLVREIPGVRVIVCDTAFWASLGKRRPDKHQIRQIRVATHAYGEMQSAWLLHCDADEYLWPREPVGEMLSRFPWVDSIAVPNLERVFVAGAEMTSIFSGAFRRPFKAGSGDGPAIMGADFDLTLRGLAGHAVGKAFTRRGLDLEIWIHRPHAKSKDPDAQPLVERAQGLELLHFEGLTPLNWMFKLMRKADAVANHNGMAPTRHRQMQVDAVLEAAHDPVKVRALHDRLKVADADLVAKLQGLGLFADYCFDPSEAMAMVFGGQATDLSVDGVDQWLWAQKGDLMRHFGMVQRQD